MSNINDLFRQRLDYEKLADGHYRAVLTLTLAGGKTYRYYANTNDADFDGDPDAISGDEIAGFFGWIKKTVKRAAHDVTHPKDVVKDIKSVAKTVKKVATSKVFLLAASGLATAIPGLGPVVGPAALAAVAAMKVAKPLIEAGIAAEHGLHDVAKKKTDAAIIAAGKSTKSVSAAKDLLAIANDKRKAVDALMSAVPKKLTLVKSSAPTSAKTTADVLTAARGGRLHSNKAGSVSQAALLAAHNKGRIFWVA